MSVAITSFCAGFHAALSAKHFVITPRPQNDNSDSFVLSAVFIVVLDC